MAHSLSQSEVDALLSGLETGSPVPSEPVPRPSPGTEGMEDMGRELALDLTTRLEHSLRSRCEVRLARIHSTNCSEALSRLDPKCVAVIESRMAGSHSLLAMDAGAVFPMVDCLLGGGSGSVETAIPHRPLTDIELKLMRRCAGQMAESLQTAWSQVQPAEFQVAHIEGRLPAAQLISPREQVVSLLFETAVNGVSGCMEFVFPARLIAKITDVDRVLIPAEDEPNPDHQTAEQTRVTVHLASLEVAPSTLASLCVGDVLPLDPQTDLTSATVLLDGEPSFRGEPGLNFGRKAVRLRRVIDPALPEPESESASGRDEEVLPS